MYDHTRLDWRVPTEEWDRFRLYVEDRYGSLEGYLGREAENAMKEYADLDDYADIEARVDHLVEAAGRRSGGAHKKIKSEFGDARSRVTVKVEATVKDKFRALAKGSENPFGVEFAKAIRAYREGGRAARLEHKLDRVLDDAAGVLAQINETDSDEDNSLSLVERNTVAIAHEMTDQFTDEELVETIKRVANVKTPSTIDGYREDVINRLDMEPHPNAPGLWIPREQAESMVPEGTPRVCRLSVGMLDREQRVERLKLEAGVRASRVASGKTKMDTSTIRSDVFDNEISKSSVRDLMRRAAETDGYQVGKRKGASLLHVNLDVVQQADRYFMMDIIDYRNAWSENPPSEPQPTSIDDYSHNESAVMRAEQELQALNGATTDGGEDEERKSR